MQCFRFVVFGDMGPDLLNAEHPIQCATAIAISDDDAARLLKQHLPEYEYRGAVVGVGTLTTPSSDRARFLAMQRSVLAAYKCVTFVCDKRFLLVLMLLEYALRPFYVVKDPILDKDTIDFDTYREEFSKTFTMRYLNDKQDLASLLYAQGSTLFGTSFEVLLSLFQSTVNQPTPERQAEFVNIAGQMRWQRLPEALGLLAEGSGAECLSALSTIDLIHHPRHIVTENLLNRMEEMAQAPYSVELDGSNHLGYYEKFQGALEQIAADEKRWRFQFLSEPMFKTRLQSVARVNSESSPAIQLAASLMSAAIEAAKTLSGRRDAGPDAEEVFSAYGEDDLIKVLPSGLSKASHERIHAKALTDQIFDYFKTH